MIYRGATPERRQAPQDSMWFFYWLVAVLTFLQTFGRMWKDHEIHFLMVPVYASLFGILWPFWSLYKFIIALFGAHGSHY